MIEVEVEDTLEDLKAFLDNKIAKKVILKDWDLTRYGDSPPIGELDGVADCEKKFVFVDKSVTRIYAKGKAKDDYIACFDLKFLKEAVDLGFEKVYIFKKDYPCICVKDSNILVIAPRVENR
jgi:hypothetical protein